MLTDVGHQLARVVDRVDARRAVRAAERRVERIVDTSAEAYVSMNDTGDIIDWNLAAERMFGVARADALGRPLADVVVPPRLREAHRAGLRRFLSTGERRVIDRRVEITAWHSTGHEFPAELAVWATPDGTRWTFSAFLHDISERRRADEQRDRLLAEQRLLLDSAVHGIYRLDGEGRCVYANPAAARLLGWPVEALTGTASTRSSTGTRPAPTARSTWPCVPASRYAWTRGRSGAPTARPSPPSTAVRR